MVVFCVFVDVLDVVLIGVGACADCWHSCLCCCDSSGTFPTKVDGEDIAAN